MSASARDALTDYLYDAFNDPPHGWSRIDCATEARDILTALSAAGFVIVPREPTEEMVSALWNALENDIPHTVTFRAALKVALSASLTRSRAPSPSQPL